MLAFGVRFDGHVSCDFNDHLRTWHHGGIVSQGRRQRDRAFIRQYHGGVQAEETSRHQQRRSKAESIPVVGPGQIQVCNHDGAM